MLALVASLVLGVPDGGQLIALEIDVTPVRGTLERTAPKLAGLNERPFVAEHDGRSFAADNDGATQQTSRWRLWSIAGKKPAALAKAKDLERAVGLAWHEGALRLAVVKPDRSNASSVNERAAALMHGDGARLAAMAGPLEGALIAFSTDGRALAREPLTEQRPAGLCATGDGWLVMVTEGTLAKGLGDAMLWARAPGADHSWERLATGLVMPGQLRCRAAWACFSEMPGDTFLARCVSPSKRASWKSKPFRTNVILREIVEQPWRLVFTELSVTGGESPEWALPLQ